MKIDAASRRAGFLPKLIRFFWIVAITTVFGPLIVGSTVFLLIALASITQTESPSFGVMEMLRGTGELFVVLVGAAYLGGGIIAFVAGILVALTTLWRQPNFLTVLGAVVVANIGYCLATVLEVFDSANALSSPSGLFVNLAFSFYAATICWLLFGRFLKRG